jgi:hypothetical protein
MSELIDKRESPGKGEEEGGIARTYDVIAVVKVPRNGMVPVVVEVVMRKGLSAEGEFAIISNLGGIVGDIKDMILRG